MTIHGNTFGRGIAEVRAFAETAFLKGVETLSHASALGAIVGASSFRVSPTLRNIPSLLLTGSVGPRTRYNGKEYLFFGGTGYLGLSRNPFVKMSSAAAAMLYGTSSSASRQTTGTSSIHLMAEGKIAEFMGTEDACLCTSGGHANEVMLEAISAENEIIICERSAHPSIFSGAAGREVLYFDQTDPASLKRALASFKSAIVAMNGVDPLSGNIAPVDRIVSVLPEGNFRVLVDDCHGVGVLGKNGRGTPEHLGIRSDRIYQTATMSKAFGCHGGFVAGSKDLCGRIRETPTYVRATALPPSDAAACFMAMSIAATSHGLRTRMLDNAFYAAMKFQSVGIESSYSGNMPVLLLSNLVGDEAEHASIGLLGHGIYLPSISYPDSNGPKRLRVAISAAHTRADIDRLCAALKSVR